MFSGRVVKGLEGWFDISMQIYLAHVVNSYEASGLR